MEEVRRNEERKGEEEREGKMMEEEALYRLNHLQ